MGPITNILLSEKLQCSDLKIIRKTSCGVVSQYIVPSQRNMYRDKYFSKFVLEQFMSNSTQSLYQV